MEIPFSRPDISEDEIQRVANVLRSGWITTGPVVGQLERKIISMTGCDGCAAFSSATAALEAILRYLGIGEGDEVIVPAYTFTATASAVVHTGARPVFMDCAPDSYEMDYAGISGIISEKTKAVIAVDLGGVIADYDRLYQAAAEKKDRFVPANPVQERMGRIAVIADAAHSFGSVRQGVPAGRWADFSAFSFHAVKNVTCAEGGAAVWKRTAGLDSGEVYRFFRTYALHGQNRDAFDREGNRSWLYDVEYPAYKCNLTDINAAIALAQMERYSEMEKKRRARIAQYDTAFSGTKLIRLRHDGEGGGSNGHLYLIRIPGATEKIRDEVIAAMKERGIACNVHYRPLPMLKAYRNMGCDIADFPNAFRQYQNTISLPLFSTLSEAQCQYVADSLLDILREKALL